MSDPGRLSGTLICLDEDPRSPTWHWSVSFNGRTHGTHCGQEADARENVLAVELEPVQAWRKDTLAGDWCEDCGAAIRDAADEAVDRGEGIATDGGQRGAPVVPSEGRVGSYPDLDPENACIGCGKPAHNHRCLCCSYPICGRHHETGGGFCPNFEAIGGIGVCNIGDGLVVGTYHLDSDHTPPLAVADGEWHLPAVADAEGYDRDASEDALCGASAVKVPAPDAVDGDTELCETCEDIALEFIEARRERREEEWAAATGDGGESDE